MLRTQRTINRELTGEAVATMDKKNVSMNDVAIAAGVSLKTVCLLYTSDAADEL